MKEDEEIKKGKMAHAKTTEEDISVIMKESGEPVRNK
jgi:hypothetical protein